MTDLLTLSGTEVSRIDYWADKVRSGMQRSLQAIIEAGKDLMAAKAELDHGDWLPMLEIAGINSRTAQELMAVAEHPVLGDARTSSLPSSLGALTALSRLPEDELAVAIEEGLITPDLTVRDARDLLKAAGRAMGGALDDDEGETAADADKVAAASPQRFAEKRDEAVFSVTRLRLDDAVTIITAPGFKLTVAVADDLLRALRPLEESRSRLLQAIEDEVGHLLPGLPRYDPPTRIVEVPAADPRDPAQVAGTSAFEAAQVSHSAV